MKPEEIIKQGECVYKKPTLLTDTNMHYCPGCSHGVVHKLIAEVIEEMGAEDKAIGVSPVGVLYLPIIISTLTGCKQLMAVRHR